MLGIVLKPDGLCSPGVYRLVFDGVGMKYSIAKL